MSDQAPTSVNCPHCKKPVIWSAESAFRPFCSERCRLQDLGAWFTEEHKISEEIVEGSEDLLSELYDKPPTSSGLN